MGRAGLALGLLMCLGYSSFSTQAAALHKDKRQTQMETKLTCDRDQTHVITDFLTSDKDCDTLVSEIVDYYDLNYRQACQYWQGGALPESIDSSYVSFCTKQEDGTTKYRAEVCCEDPTTELRCFTCSNSRATLDDFLSYNTLGCIYRGGGPQTCRPGEVCMSDVTYPVSGNGVHSKGCMDKARCESKMDPERCRSGVKDPACTYCCSESYCNYENSIKYISVGTGVGDADACKNNPCYPNGECQIDATAELGYVCICNAGREGIRCERTPCTPSPCQNGGFCVERNVEGQPLFECRCRAAYTGTTCQINFPLCATNVCQNSGTCYDSATGPRCICTADFVGDVCTIPVPQECPVKDHVFTVATDLSQSSHMSCTQKLESVRDIYKSAYVNSCIIKMKELYGKSIGFVQGVNGNVLTTHGVSLSRCEKGDVNLFFDTTTCCPACLSNPCQNGGWCQQHEKGPYTCKCRYGYTGVNCQFKEAICYASGDPHYFTIDRKGLTFQSPCKYDMLKTTASSEQTAFQVLVKHENRYGVTTVAYVKYVEVIFGSQTVKLDRHKFVTVNGEVSAAGGTYEGFKLMDNGRFLRLETDFGLVVESDGEWLVVVKVPDTYRNNVEGLCGNFDDNRDNDLTTREGVDVRNEENADTIFGNSYQVDDPTDPTCRNTDGPPPTCPEALEAEIKSVQYCGMILDATTTNPLQKCVQNPKATPQEFFDSCVYDACANQDRWKVVVCKSIEAFASACKDLGYVREWRAHAKCGLNCSEHSQYFAKTSACQATCSNPDAASECSLPDTENCICDAGYVMANNECILPTQCGCVDSNYVRHELDSEWLSKDCVTSYKCTRCTNDCSSGYQIVATQTNGCTNNQNCELDDGLYHCVTKGCDINGQFVGIGVTWQNSCSENAECTVNGIVTTQVDGCEENEKCTVGGAGQYECKAQSCINPDNGTHHQLGDTWLSSTCEGSYVCNTDGSISSSEYACPSSHECQLQGELYLCVVKTCRDERRGIRQLGSRWMSADCSYIATCLASGIDKVAHACQTYETCQPGDLGRCVSEETKWSAWGPWDTCSGRCGSGSQRRFRTCQSASGAQCEGVSTESRQCQCNHQFDVQDCDRCKFVSNVLGYLPDLCDCQSFIQCDNSTGDWVAHHRKCAPCTEWDQDKVTCDHVKYKCTDKWGGSGPDIDVFNDYCIHSSYAKFRPHATDDQKYQWEVLGGMWVTMPCAPGTVFKMMQCGCVHDPNYIKPERVTLITCLSFDITLMGSRNVWADGVGVIRQAGVLGQAAYFDGNAKIEVPFFTNRIAYAQFSVSLWFKRTGYSSRTQGILTNGDCARTASVEIKSVSESTVSARIDTQGGDANTADLKAVADQWHHIVVVYNGNRLSVYLNNVMYSSNQAVGGLLEQRHCPILIGSGGPGLGFTGFIDQVCFYEDALGASDVLKLYQEVRGSIRG